MILSMGVPELPEVSPKVVPSEAYELAAQALHDRVCATQNDPGHTGNAALDCRESYNIIAKVMLDAAAPALQQAQADLHEDLRMEDLVSMDLAGDLGLALDLLAGDDPETITVHELLVKHGYRNAGDPPGLRQVPVPVQIREAVEARVGMVDKLAALRRKVEAHINDLSSKQPWDNSRLLQEVLDTLTGLTGRGAS